MGPASIQKRSLGQSDLEVTPVGLGVMQFSGGKGMFRAMFNDIDQTRMDAIVQAALDGGINWFDTAEMYGGGVSERGLANALKVAAVEDDEVIIGTKWNPLFRTANNIPRTIGDRLHYLDNYTIDLYMIHQPYGFSPPEAEMEAMADLVEVGAIRYVGVSNFNVDQMRRAYETLARRGLPLAVNQVQYSLLNRKIETSGVLEAARDLGVTIVAWSPLARGILSGKFHKDPDRLNQTPFGRRLALRRQLDRSREIVEALEEIAGAHEATASEVALNWLTRFQGETVVAIPGASQVRHAEEAARASRINLADEELDRLDQLSRGFR